MPPCGTNTRWLLKVTEDRAGTIPCPPRHHAYSPSPNTAGPYLTPPSTRKRRATGILCSPLLSSALSCCGVLLPLANSTSPTPQNTHAHTLALRRGFPRCRLLLLLRLLHRPSRNAVVAGTRQYRSPPPPGPRMFYSDPWLLRGWPHRQIYGVAIATLVICFGGSSRD